MDMIRASFFGVFFMLFIGHGDQTYKLDKQAPAKMLAGISPAINGNARFLTEEVFIAGGCFDVSNARTRGSFGAIGTFSNGESSIGIDNGIILSTGSVLNASGPNTATNFTTNFNNGASDADLAQIIDNALIPIRDVAILEFDFTPTADQVQFKYVFASEEYCDFVNSDYNDIFGFFISGPGISGPFTNNAENIALVPGSSDYVAINNINHLSNANSYIDNIPANHSQLGNCPGGYPNTDGVALGLCEYDGFTKVLRASANVIPCQTYHIKLVIGDITDGQYDSAVFLEANSFEAGESVVVEGLSPSFGGNIVQEGCSDAYFLFQRFGNDLSNSMRVNFDVSPTSTARAGSDYENFPTTITFPPNVGEVRLPIQVLMDGLPEGDESIVLALESACSCNSTFTSLIIRDGTPLQASINNLQLCEGESGDLTAEVFGGLGPYTYRWSTGATSNMISVNPNNNQNYTLSITDACGSEFVANAAATIIQPPLAQLDGQVIICNDEPLGQLNVILSENDQWELTYSINGQIQPPIRINESPYALPITVPGLYRLESVVTGNCQGTVVGEREVRIANLEAITSQQNPTCHASNDGRIEVTVTNGEAPYRFRLNRGNFQANGVFNALNAGNYSVEVQDISGCTWTKQVALSEPTALSISTTTNIQGCGDGMLAELHISVQGGQGRLQYSLDGTRFQDTPIYSDLPLGQYTIWVRDQTACEMTQSLLISPPNPMEIQVIKQDISCPEAGDGQIILLASGGRAPYEYGINDAPLQTNNTFQNLLPGRYELTVRDSRACEETTHVTIQDPAPLLLMVAEIKSPACPGGNDGGLTIDVSGGTGNRNYHWSNGAQTRNLVDVQAGIYTLSVSDAAGCQSEIRVEIPGEPWPATLISGSRSICEGESSSLSGPTGEGFIYEWSTGETQRTIVVDTPGDYRLQVTNLDGCVVEQSIRVENSNVLSPIITGPSTFCEGDSVELRVGQYSSYHWSNGATSPSIIIYAGGIYSVTVSQGETCTGTASIELTVQTPSSIEILGNTEICETQSSVLSIQGEFQDYEWSTGNFGAEIQITAGGTYAVSVTDENNCMASESIVVEELKQGVHFEQLTICEGDSIVWNDQTLHEAGTYEFILRGAAANSCDSIETLELKVNQPSVHPFNIVITEWQTYPWRGAFLSETGIFRDTLWGANAAGCDSVLQLALTVLPISFDSISLEMCEGDSVWVSNQWQYSAGTYTDTLANTDGLDSLVLTTHLEVHPTYHTIEMIELCDGELWEGQVYGQDTTIVNHYQTAFGCDSLLEYELSIHPVFDVVKAVTICQGDSFYVDGIWQKTAGLYHESWLTDYGCDSLITIDLTVDECLFFTEINSQGVTCYDRDDGRLTLTVSAGVGPFVLEWYDHQFQLLERQEIPAAGNFRLEGLSGGNYHAQVVDISTANQVDVSVSINEPGPLEVELSESYPLSCATGSDAALRGEATGGTAPYQYQWTIQGEEAEITELSAGTYGLTVQDANGCIQQTEHEIIAPEDLSAQAFFDPGLCDPAEGGILTFKDISGGTAPYLYSIDQMDFQHDSTLIVTRFPSTAMIQDVNGCEWAIPVQSLPEASLAISVEATKINLGDTIALTLTTTTDQGFSAIHWTPAADLSCTDCPNPMAFPHRSTTFKVEVKNQLGCTAEATIPVLVDKNPRIFIPNAFSPNGDGQNDLFAVFGGPELIRVEQLAVFDRWGSQLFTTKNAEPNTQQSGWDGRYRGKDVAAGVYVYLAIVKLSNGTQKTLKGEVVLIR